MSYPLHPHLIGLLATAKTVYQQERTKFDQINLKIYKYGRNVSIGRNCGSYLLVHPSFETAYQAPLWSVSFDDQTAIVVRDGAVEVVSEGYWKRFTPSGAQKS